MILHRMCKGVKGQGLVSKVLRIFFPRSSMSKMTPRKTFRIDKIWFCQKTKRSNTKQVAKSTTEEGIVFQQKLGKSSIFPKTDANRPRKRSFKNKASYKSIYNIYYINNNFIIIYI